MLPLITGLLVEDTRIYVTVDADIERQTFLQTSYFRFKQDERYPGLYYGRYGPWVMKFSYSGPGSGYGGRSISITMETGERRTLEGPWSSRIGIFNALGYDQAVDIEIVSSFLNLTGGKNAWVTIDYIKPILLAQGYVLSRQVNKLPIRYQDINVHECYYQVSTIDTGGD